MNLFAQNNIHRGTLPSPQNLPPDVYFSWNGACLGDTVCFINQTIRGNTYTWTVTDTSIVPHQAPIDTLFISSDTNICFHFPGPGTYSVSLHAYNNHDVTLTKVIKIDTLIKADFSFVGCSNQFANTSLCATSFNWDFGDGNTSTAPYPVHQYAGTGSYNVQLIAKNGNKADTLKKVVQINEIAFASAAFTYSISCDTVVVHANYAWPASFYWNFNDPVNYSKNYATGRDTTHLYKDSVASYNIGLTAINQCGPAFGSDTIRIVFPGTAFSYTVSYDTVFVHANYSSLATFNWNFGDTRNPGSNFATGRDAIHVYKDSMANYNVGLTVTNQCGAAHGNDSVKITLLPSHLNFRSNLAVVPNPVSGDNINVYYSSYNSANFLAQVYNMMGEKTFEEYFAFEYGINGFKIPVFQLAEGAYILILQSENTYVRKKFLVARHQN